MYSGPYVTGGLGTTQCSRPVEARERKSGALTHTNPSTQSDADANPLPYSPTKSHTDTYSYANTSSEPYAHSGSQRNVRCTLADRNSDYGG